MNIQVTLQENLSGGANRKVPGYWLFAIIWVLFLMIAQGCTIQSPKLNNHILPAKYEFKADKRDSNRQKNIQFNTVLLNDNSELNSLIVQFWKTGSFNKLLATKHPYLTINRSHIEAVEAGLNKLFMIYYLSGDSKWNPGQTIFFRPEDYSEDCRPLSNHEIQFMLNKSAESAFSTLVFTMIVISSHELAQQHGGKPIYPMVSSPFLRKRFNLPELTKIQDYNLFATKYSGRFNLNKPQGFVFCRKIN